MESAQNVVYQYVSLIVRWAKFGLVYHGKSATLLQGRGSELVSVERFAFKGEENATRGAVAAVGGYYGVAFENLI